MKALRDLLPQSGVPMGSEAAGQTPEKIVDREVKKEALSACQEAAKPLSSGVFT